MAKPNFKLSKRMVSARFWTNPELSRLAKQSKIPNLKLTMIGLWAFSDEAGIFEWQPDIAAGMIYGLDTEASLGRTQRFSQQFQSLPRSGRCPRIPSQGWEHPQFPSTPL
jgi:hypothetical protein